MSLLVSRCLGDDVEVRVGEPVGLDALEEPPERRSVRHVGRLRLARATSEHATDTTTDVGDDRARIAGLREHLGLTVVVDNPPLHGGLVDGRVVEVVADDAEDAVRAVDGGASGVTVLDHQQAELAVQVPHIGVAHQVVTDGAHEGKVTIVRESELPVGVSAGITLERELVGIQFRS
jgi:hypothetical protein